MFRNIMSAGTSNVTGHAHTGDNSSDTKAVEVKIERESDDELEIEIEFNRVIKEERTVWPAETGSQEKHSDVSQHQNSNDRIGSISTLETEAMATVKQEQIEEIHADDKFKYEIVIVPLVQQTANDVMEGKDTSLAKKLELGRQDGETDQTEKAKEIDTGEVKTTNDMKPERTIKIKQEKSPVKHKNFNQRPSYNVFTCNDCGKHFRRKRELVTHIESHEKIKLKIYLKCKECTYQTVTRESLERHETVHDKNLHFVCDMCDYRFSDDDTKQKHMRSVHKKMHECSVCDYKTNNFGHISNHLRVHTDEKPYLCTVCEYRCTQKSSLTRHLRIHSGVDPYPCIICEKRFTEKCNLMKHLKTHTEHPYSCTVCEYKCARKSTLTRHMRIHTGNKPFACSLCTFKSCDKSSLTTHLRVHSGEKPFSCSLCSYKCVQKTALKIHFRIHTGDKPYMCTICEYRCTQKTVLNTHLRIHSGSKPYSCSVCGYKSTQKGNLTKHMRIHKESSVEATTSGGLTGDEVSGAVS